MLVLMISSAGSKPRETNFFTFIHEMLTSMYNNVTVIKAGTKCPLCFLQPSDVTAAELGLLGCGSGTFGPLCRWL